MADFFVGNSGIGPLTSCVSSKRSTTELIAHWDQLGSNQRPFDYESSALPLSYGPVDANIYL